MASNMPSVIASRRMGSSKLGSGRRCLAAAALAVGLAGTPLARAVRPRADAGASASTLPVAAPSPEWSVKGVLAALNDPDVRVRGAAYPVAVRMRTSTGIPGGTVPMLLRLGSPVDNAARDMALASLTTGEVDALVKGLKEMFRSTHGQPAWALDVLTKLGSRAAPVAENLAGIVRDENVSDGERNAAAWTLLHVGNVPPDIAADVARAVAQRVPEATDLVHLRGSAPAAAALVELVRRTDEGWLNVARSLQIIDPVRFEREAMSRVRERAREPDSAYDKIHAAAILTDVLDEHVREEGRAALAEVARKIVARARTKTARGEWPPTNTIDEFSHEVENLLRFDPPGVNALREASAGLESKIVTGLLQWRIERIASFARAWLHDGDAAVRAAAALALARDAAVAPADVPTLQGLLGDVDPSVADAAALALVCGGAGTEPLVVRVAATLGLPAVAMERQLLTLQCLGKMGVVAAPALPVLKRLLDNTDRGIAFLAGNALCAIGEPARALLPELLKRGFIEQASAGLGPVTLEQIPLILEPMYRNSGKQSGLLVLAHVAGGADQEIETLLHFAGRLDEDLPADLRDRPGALQALAAIEKVWPKDRRWPGFRGDVAARAAEMVRVVQSRGQWSKDDAPHLEALAVRLQFANPSEATEVRAVVAVLTAPRFTPQQLATWLGEGWLGHAAFWLLLLFAYPYWSSVRAMFFWNPWVRRIAGAGYVGWLLTWVPFFRRRLFAPFRDTLLADAALDGFDPTAYFADADADVQERSVRRRTPLRQAIPAILGQVVLFGDSGLGKTMFLRDLVRRSEQVVAYLPAAKCSVGVIEAILAKLEGPAKDADYLRALVYAGAIDVVIDGLNEVSADTRAKVTKFADDFTRGNILMATQKIGDWEPPPTARTVVLLPLDESRAREFLVGREPTLNDALVRGDRFDKACRELLSRALRKDRPREVLDETRRVLSNPMDLTVVAEMLGRGKMPDLYRLDEQQYEQMAEEYKEANRVPFPLESFAEQVYKMRTDDVRAFDDEKWSAEIRALKKHRMVVVRSEKDAFKGAERTDYRFRHDKVSDFFVARAFMDKHADRRLPNLADPRFKGVYFLLAVQLPLPEAEALQQALVEHAAATGDITVLRGFVMLLKGRKAARS